MLRWNPRLDTGSAGQPPDGVDVPERGRPRHRLFQPGTRNRRFPEGLVALPVQRPWTTRTSTSFDIAAVALATRAVGAVLRNPTYRVTSPPGSSFCASTRRTTPAISAVERTMVATA